MRCYHLPSQPFTEYKAISAIVIKDRSSIGKFKLKSSANRLILFIKKVRKVSKRSFIQSSFVAKLSFYKGTGNWNFS